MTDSQRKTLWCFAISGRQFQVDISICENKCKSRKGKMKCKSYLKYLEEIGVRRKLKRRNLNNG